MHRAVQCLQRPRHAGTFLCRSLCRCMHGMNKWGTLMLLRWICWSSFMLGSCNHFKPGQLQSHKAHTFKRLRSACTPWSSTVSGCCVQVRNMQREVSRDADIVVAAMISIVGSTLIFQGWRLDPLLLLCQVRAAGTVIRHQHRLFNSSLSLSLSTYSLDQPLTLSVSWCVHRCRR